MKVISLLQPWASLIVAGHKKIETRSWNTKYRGELLIHSSSGWSGLQNEISCKEPFYKLLTALGFTGVKAAHKCGLPLGAIIGKVEIASTLETEKIILCKDAGIPLKEDAGFNKEAWDLETAFGDFTKGRFGWLTKNPVQFKEPIPAKGNRGFWNYDLKITEDILSSMGFEPHAFDTFINRSTGITIMQITTATGKSIFKHNGQIVDNLMTLQSL